MKSSLRRKLKNGDVVQYQIVSPVPNLNAYYYAKVINAGGNYVLMNVVTRSILGMAIEPEHLEFSNSTIKITKIISE